MHSRKQISGRSRSPKRVNKPLSSLRARHPQRTSTRSHSNHSLPVQKLLPLTKVNQHIVSHTSTSRSISLTSSPRRRFSNESQEGHGCGCGSGGGGCGSSQSPDNDFTPEEQERLTAQNIKTIERMRNQQRDFSLRLYRSILRAHRYLPPDMRLVGDAYVKEEFHLHKTAKPEHLQPFYDQWIEYLVHLRSAFDSPETLGQNIPHEDLDALDDEKREKLFQMHDETARIFGGHLFPSDLGLDHVPQELEHSGIFATDQQYQEQQQIKLNNDNNNNNTARFTTTSVQQQQQQQQDV